MRRSEMPGVLSDPGSQARPTAIHSVNQCLNDFRESSERSVHDKQALGVTVLARRGRDLERAMRKRRSANVMQSFDASPLGRAWLRRCVSVARGPWLGATERNLQLVLGRCRLAEFPSGA